MTDPAARQGGDAALGRDPAARPGATREHALKVWPEYYRAVAEGTKLFELRRHDRDFIVGDVLWLREWDQLKRRYTGRSLRRSITYVMVSEQARWLSGAQGDDPLGENFCILGLEDVPAEWHREVVALPAATLTAVREALEEAATQLESLHSLGYQYDVVPKIRAALEALREQR